MIYKEQKALEKYIKEYVNNKEQKYFFLREIINQHKEYE